MSSMQLLFNTERQGMKTHCQSFVMQVTAMLMVVLLAGQGVAQDAKDVNKDSFVMKIQVTANNKTTVFLLNDSQAAKELFAQLPLTIEVKDYSDDEKIFYPPKKLNTTNTPLANAKAGTLAYYAPWGDVVMFYDDFGSASGLYELGHAVSGSEYIREMSGTIQIENITN